MKDIVKIRRLGGREFLGRVDSVTFWRKRLRG